MQNVTEIKFIVFVGSYEAFLLFRKHQPEPFREILRYSNPTEPSQIEGYTGALFLVDRYSSRGLIRHHTFGRVSHCNMILYV